MFLRIAYHKVPLIRRSYDLRFGGYRVTSPIRIRTLPTAAYAKGPRGVLGGGRRFYMSEVLLQATEDPFVARCVAVGIF